MKKRLTGKKKPLNSENTKWEITVNMGYNPATKIYERKYRTFYGNGREADAFLRDFITELENEEREYSYQPTGEWLDYWLKNYGKVIYNWEKNTCERAYRIVNTNIKPYIGTIPLSALEPEHIVEFYTLLKTKGKVIKKKDPEQTAVSHATGILTVTGTGVINSGDIFQTKKGIQFEATETKEITESGTINIQAIIVGASGIVPAKQINQIPVPIPGITTVNNPEPTLGKTIIIREPLATRTVKYVHTLLNQSLKEAVKLKKIPENPCTGLSPKADKGNPHEKWVVLNAKQLKEFLSKILNHQDYTLIYTAAYSGARQSELLGLEKDCILWDKSSIRIKQALHLDDESEDGYELRPRTKNIPSTRTIKLSKKTMDALAEHIRQQEEKGIKSNLVFTEPDGSAISRDNLGHRFSNLAKKQGYPGMTFHHLRHTHATILLSNGAYINEVAKRLGHSDPKITLSVYGHCLPEGEDALVKQFDTLLDNE
ncbi:MAG: tyrosine-type recombinase/integrase [Syntrophomonas sp.]